MSPPLTKENDVYQIKDNNYLPLLTVSHTSLFPTKSTNGHSHQDKDEVYFFESGNGKLIINHNQEYFVKGGDIYLISAGDHHRVENLSSFHSLVFTCVFNGERNH